MADEHPRPHESRFLVLARAIHPGGLSQQPLPESDRWIDLFVAVGEPSDAWGVLRAELADRVLVMEHFSTPPGPKELATAILKTAWGVERWLDGAWPSTRPPLGLVISVGSPRAALQRFKALRPGGVRGIYRSQGALQDMLLVDVRDLPRGHGHSFLRLLDHRPEVLEANLLDLWKDPTVSTLTKTAIGGAMRNNPQTFSTEELALTADELVALGETKGRAEEGRGLLEALLVARFGPLPQEVVARLGAATSEQRLTWAVRVLEAGSLAEVFEG